MWNGKNRGAERRNFTYLRTDLALEERESFPGDGGEISGVSLREWKEDENKIRLTEVRILNSRGARAMRKPEGAYITIEADFLSTADQNHHKEASKELARQLGRLFEDLGLKRGSLSVLVAGLGNASVTPDSLGPRVTEALPVSKTAGSGRAERPVLRAVAPGVMGQTGMETAQILRGIVREVRPDLLIAVDALAARSVRRLGTTLQLTDTGISPGSGVGNHRHSLTKESLGIPVIAIGVPTVVGGAAIVHDTISVLMGVLAGREETRGTGRWIRDMEPEEQYQLIRELLEPEFGPLYVTPPDIDQIIGRLGTTISRGIAEAVFT